MAHGLNASRKEIKKGFDYQGKRAGNKSQCNAPSSHKKTKIITHRLERQMSKRIVLNYLSGDLNEK